jgi:hypothetical protein
VKEFGHEHGSRDASFYNWRRRFDGIDVADARHCAISRVRTEDPRSFRPRRCQVSSRSRASRGNNRKPAIAARSGVGAAGEDRHIRASGVWAYGVSRTVPRYRSASDCDQGRLREAFKSLAVYRRHSGVGYRSPLYCERARRSAGA